MFKLNPFTVNDDVSICVKHFRKGFRNNKQTSNILLCQIIDFITSIIVVCQFDLIIKYARCHVENV